jgi:ribonuclease P protein component
LIPNKPFRRFTRQNRLLNPSDFKYVFDQPVKAGNPYLTVLARPNGKEFARLGLAVPKRQIKNAVMRNRIKRIIRESFRYNQTRLAGLDLVVLVRAGASRVANPTFLQDLDKLWDRLKKQCENSLST